MNELEKQRLRDAFATYLPLPATLALHLHEALQQVLRNAGSMLRSQIVLQVSAVYDVPRVHAEKLAMALEYFHTASLLFDDLPCMDMPARV